MQISLSKSLLVVKEIALCYNCYFFFGLICISTKVIFAIHDSFFCNTGLSPEYVYITLKTGTGAHKSFGDDGEKSLRWCDIGHKTRVSSLRPGEGTCQ